MIVFRTAPAAACVFFVMSRPFFIDGTDFFRRFPFCQAIAGHCPLSAESFRRMDEKPDGMWTMTQNHICTTPYNDTASLCRDFGNHFPFCQKQSVCRRHIFTRISIELCQHFLQHRVMYCLFVFLYKISGKTAFLCCHIDDASVIERNAQFFCQCFANVMSAAAIFSGNGDNQTVFRFCLFFFFFGFLFPKSNPGRKESFLP